MCLKRGICYVLLGGVMASGWIHAETLTFRFSGQWGDEQNWGNRRVLSGQPDTRVFVEDDATATITTAVAANRVLLGNQGSPGHLILDGAEAELTLEILGVGRLQEQGTLGAEGSLVVRNGAVLKVMDYLAVGYEGVQATFDLYDGTVSADRLVQSADGERGGVTTLHGGVLTVRQLVVEGGVINIAGGILQVSERAAAQVRKLISNGTIRFNGSSEAVRDLDYTIEKIDGDISIQLIVGAPARVG
jgi:hypothetical protein